MKTIKNFNANRLTTSQFGQHIKNISNNIIQLGEDFISDENVINYIYGLNQKLNTYETALQQFKSSKETLRILDSDKERENSITSVSLLLNVYELSDNPKELEACAIISSVIKKFAESKNWSFDEETKNYDWLIEELTSIKLQSYTSIIKMEPFIMEIQITNSIFKTFYSERSADISTTEIYDVKTLRNEINEINEDMVQYLYIMSKAVNTEEYRKPLHLINTIREYYAELVVKGNNSQPEISEPQTTVVSQN